MSAQVQFGGTIPFRDRSTGSTVQVRVWGAFVGQGADAHEAAAIQQWIMNALSTSAQSYDGAIHDLPAKAAEWGGYVSQQLAPQLAQQFQAHGQIQIHGVTIEGADHGKGAPMKAPMGAAPMAMGGMDPGAIERAASALVTQMGVPLDQARHAAQIVAQALGVGGAAGTPAYKQAYEKQQHGKPGYDAKGQPLYDQKAGYDAKGQPLYDQKAGYDAKGQPQYDQKAGYDAKGQPQYGYDAKGQPQYGYDQKGQPQYGYDQKGQPQHEKQQYDTQQYDKQGYDPGGKDPGQWKK